jgi:acetyl esterase/lipase
VGLYDDGDVASSEGNLTTSDGGVLLYRLYVPKEEKNKQDLFLWVYGGGFVLGHIWEFQIDSTCRRIAADAKIRVVSVEYRKSHSHHIMAGMQDIQQAVQLIKSSWAPQRLGRCFLVVFWNSF